MVIYIQSRGISQENDYRWLKIEQNNWVCEIPAFLNESINGLRSSPIELIDSQKFSIVLARSAKNLFLLVTGLKTREERTDFMGRKVRNSVIWLYPNTWENELKLRSLTVIALRGELDFEIDRAIATTGEYGFEIDRDLIKQISNSRLVQNDNNTEISQKIGKNSEEVKQELALELEINQLPQKNGILVLLTTIKTELALIDLGVWRGLSNRVQYEKLTSIEPLSQKKTFIPITIAGILTVATVILTILLLV